MPGLLGPNGQPIASSNFYKTRDPKPVMGEAFGSWNGHEVRYATLPGGGALQFDTNRLTLADFRLMRENYQINASLSCISFMMHQLDWQIECDDQKIVDHVTANMTSIWTALVRGMSQAFWAGFAPNILQWENDDRSNSVQLTKVKDLMPEMCRVNWKLVQGAKLTPNTIPQRIKIYDGIKQAGLPGPIPVQNTLWYPLLRENGDYYGRKILKAAFQPWYFSQLMHMFSNRYFERFGEPTPVGRAPYDDDVQITTTETVDGRTLMAQQMQNLRNRGVVVLPNSRTANSGGTGTDNYDYTLEYLESQMRGADFERYMMRLDEEMSLALFTPLLLLRTSDVGSYSLGTGHMQMFLWELNAIAADWGEYINKYVIRPMVSLNFPTSNKIAEIKFRKLGMAQEPMVRGLLMELVRAGQIQFDLTELGQSVGLTIEQADLLSNPNPLITDPNVVQLDSNTQNNPVIVDKTKTSGVPTKKTAPSKDGRVGGPRPQRTSTGRPSPTATKTKILQRISPQVTNAFEKGTFGEDFVPSLGYHRAVTDMFNEAGAADPAAAASLWFDAAVSLLVDASGPGTDAWDNDPAKFMAAADIALESLFNKHLESVA
jgi:hypothetical protein